MVAGLEFSVHGHCAKNLAALGIQEIRFGLGLVFRDWLNALFRPHKGNT